MRRAIRYSMVSAMVILLSACDEARLLEPEVGTQEAPVAGGGRRDRCDVGGAAAGPHAVPDRRDCGLEDDEAGRPAEI